jgi:hypothetical protein
MDPSTNKRILQKAMDDTLKRALERQKQDYTDLIAAALGLRSSAVAQAAMHLMGKPGINGAINGVHVEGPDKKENNHA